MSAPVPQAAVDAAMKAMGCAKSLAPFMVGEVQTWDCFRHGNYWTDQGCPHAQAIAAAVVAAVQGPLQAQALREAAEGWDDDAGPLARVSSRYVRKSLLRRADRIEADDA